MTNVLSRYLIETVGRPVTANEIARAGLRIKTPKIDGRAENRISKEH